MSSRHALVLALIVASMPALSCSADRRATMATKDVPPGAIAVVGQDVVDVAAVTQVAVAQGVTPAVAAERVVSDAVLAAGARRSLGEASFRQARRGALTRMLLEGFVEESRGRGPPTDDEVARETQKRWWELDRPPLRRVTHAVIRVKGPADEARARVVGARLAERVAGVSDPAAFRAAAMSVVADGLEVAVEDLAPFTSDGTVVDIDAPELKAPGGAYLPEFAAAAFAIPAVGRTSPVVRTEFGYHVILYVESIPEHRVPLEERRQLLYGDIMNARANALYEEALNHAKSVDDVSYERSAVDSMLHIKTAP